MIYPFNQVEERKLRILYEFLISKGKNLYFNEYEEMIKNYNSIVFNNGETFFTVWKDDVVKGTLGLITKDIKEKGEAFVTGINIAEGDKGYVRELLERAIHHLEPYKPRRIILGVHSGREYLMDYIEASGFEQIYRAVVLRLESEKMQKGGSLADSLRFEGLAEENKGDFKHIHNEAFRNSPNGSMLEDEQIEEVLQEFKAGGAITGVCYFDEKPAGIFELRVKGGIGWIDAIGVHPAFWGKGIGKSLLFYSVGALKKAGAEDIKLMVMSANKTAYDLYKACGFGGEETVSYWFERTMRQEGAK